MLYIHTYIYGVYHNGYLLSVQVPVLDESTGAGMTRR